MENFTTQNQFQYTLFSGYNRNINSHWLFSLKILTVLALIFFTTGCFKNFGTRKTNHHLGVSITIPDNWEEVPMDTLQEMNTIAFEDHLSGLISLTRVDAVNTEQWLNEIIYRNKPIIKRGKLFSYKYKIYWVYYEKGGLSHIDYVIKDNRAYVYALSCICLTKDYKKNRKLFNRVARSFQEI